MDTSIALDSLEAPSSTIEDLELCSHCGKKNNPGDSFTMDGDGQIVRCEHWPPIGLNQKQNA